MTRHTGSGLVIFLLTARVAFGCSSDQGDSSGSADAGVDVLADAAQADVVQLDAVDPDPVPPPGLPEGWEIERTYSKHCGIYKPKTKDNLPAPISWESCPSSAPAGAECRLMVPPDAPFDVRNPGGAEVAAVNADGSVVLVAYRSVQPGWGYRLVADADGPVHAAYLLTDPRLCNFATPSLSGEHYAMRVFEHAASTGGGIVASEWTSGGLSPRIAVHLSSASAHTPYAGPFAIVDLTAGFTLDQYSWADGAKLVSLWSAVQDNGLQQGIPVFASGAAFWPSSNLRYHKVKVYTQATGVRDLLSAGMVTTKGYGDLGTDGDDLVWIEAAGRTTETGPFDSYTIMTAPFTTDPAQVVSRRLRTEEGPDFDVVYFQVGCGYAARSNGAHIRVVRLSDGQSWVLSNGLSDPFGWSAPLALTCTELFATVQVSGVTRLARVRLDSLGSGIPAD
jgi:hypothetical protein